jgi:hypothetical protein
MGELIVCKRDAFAFLTRRGSDRFRDIPKLTARLVPNPFLLQDEAYSRARSNVSSEGSVSQGSSPRCFQGSTQKPLQGVKSDSTSSEDRVSTSGGKVAERSGWRSRDQSPELGEVKQVKLGLEAGEKKGAHNRTLRRKFVLERWPTCDPHLLTKTDSDGELFKSNGSVGSFEASLVGVDQGSPDADPIGVEPSTLPKLKTNGGRGELIPGSAADGGEGFGYEGFSEGDATSGRESARAAPLPRNSSWGPLPAGARAAWNGGVAMPRARSSALLAREADGLVPAEVEDMLAEMELSGRNGFGSQVSLAGFEVDTGSASQLQEGKEGVSEDRTGFQGEAGKFSSGLGGTESAGDLAQSDIVGELRDHMGGPEDRANGILEQRNENRIDQGGIGSNQEEVGLAQEIRGQDLEREVVTTNAPAEENGDSETEAASGGRNPVAETEPEAITFEEWQRLDGTFGDSDCELETKEDCVVGAGPSENGTQHGSGTGEKEAARNTYCEQGIGKRAEENGTSENGDISLDVKRKSKGPKGKIESNPKDRTIYEEGGISVERNGNGKRNGDGLRQQVCAGKAVIETGGQGERSGTTETELEARKGNGHGRQLRDVNGNQESRGMIEQNGKPETEPDGQNNQMEGRMITKISEGGGQSVLASKEISLGGYITEERSSESKASDSTKQLMANGRVEKSGSNASVVGESVSSVKERRPVAASLRTEKAGESATEKGAAKKGMTGTTNGSRSGESAAELRSGAGMAGGVKTGGRGGKAMRSYGVNKRVAVTAGGVNAGRGVEKAGAGSSDKGSGSGKEGREGRQITTTAKQTGKGAFGRDMRVCFVLVVCVVQERCNFKLQTGYQKTGYQDSLPLFRSDALSLLESILILANTLHFVSRELDKTFSICRLVKEDDPS